MKVGDKPMGGLLQFGIRASWIPWRDLKKGLWEQFWLHWGMAKVLHNLKYHLFLGIQLALIPHCNTPPTNLSRTFMTTILNPNDELKNSIFFLIKYNCNHGPSRSWSKLNHPTIGERQKDPLSSPELPLMPNALLLFPIFTYNKRILFIALSFSSIMNLLSLVLWERSSSWNCLIPTWFKDCLFPMVRLLSLDRDLLGPHCN